MSGANPGSRLPVPTLNSARSIIHRNQLYGLTCLLVGMCQLPLAFVYADLPDQPLPLFVIGGGGWLLISAGVNLLQGEKAFQNGWTENERIEWLSAAGLVLLSLLVVAATGHILLSR